MDAVKAPGIVARHPELRWLASVVVVVAVIAAVTSYVSGAFHDESSLTVTGPDQLVSEVRAPHVGGYTGTILAKVDVGLPHRLTAALERVLPYGGALLDGSHTMRYWYGSPAQQRVAIINQNNEQDVFRSGDRMTLWDSATRTYDRQAVGSDESGLPIAAGPAAMLSPPELAEQILALPDSARTTTLRSGDQVVPGRPTYELVVVPTSARSLIGEVDIQIDGRQAVPLRVQIYARGASQAAVDVAFTSISYGAPQERNFTFTPPADALARSTAPLPTQDLRTVGTGWLTLLSYPTTAPVAELVRQTFGPKLHAVHGKWGSGRVYTAGLLSVLVTNKAQLLAGAVQPSVLYAAVRKR